MSKRTRFLGVDFGTVRIGLAVTDSDRMIVSPLSIYQRGGKEKDARFFRALVEEENIGAIVIGLPVHTTGTEGVKAREARDFGAWLAKTTGLPVKYWDERFTTVEAEHFLLDAGLTNKKRKARRDMLAAQIMLQSYLDAGCPDDEGADEM